MGIPILVELRMSIQTIFGDPGELHSLLVAAQILSMAIDGGAQYDATFTCHFPAARLARGVVQPYGSTPPETDVVCEYEQCDDDSHCQMWDELLKTSTDP